VISLAETHDPLDQLGASDHSFQPKEITHSLLTVGKENNHCVKPISIIEAGLQENVFFGHGNCI